MGNIWKIFRKYFLMIDFQANLKFILKYIFKNHYLKFINFKLTNLNQNIIN